MVVPVGLAYIGGLPDVLMEGVGTTIGHRQILTMKHTLGNYPENTGVTGISKENRSTGAEEEHATQSAIARSL